MKNPVLAIAQFVFGDQAELTDPHFNEQSGGWFAEIVCDGRTLVSAFGQDREEACHRVGIILRDLATSQLRQLGEMVDGIHRVSW